VHIATKCGNSGGGGEGESLLQAHGSRLRVPEAPALKSREFGGKVSSKTWTGDVICFHSGGHVLASGSYFVEVAAL
jgi:hypothetical protein